MWLTIFWCVAAVALMLGPIFLLRPSASQQREARLRELALQKGLRVHLHEPPQGTDCPPQRKLLPLYCRPWEASQHRREVWSLVRKKYAHDLHYDGVWDWGQKPARLPDDVFKACLQAVPERVLGILSGPQGICVFWDESGGEAQLERIAEWLQDSAEQLTLARLAG